MKPKQSQSGLEEESRLAVVLDEFKSNEDITQIYEEVRKKR